MENFKIPIRETTILWFYKNIEVGVNFIFFFDKVELVKLGMIDM
jgi:hypothetical protein